MSISKVSLMKTLQLIPTMIVLKNSLNLLSFQAPFKERMVRANQRVFLNKEIHKAIMIRSRLKTKFLKEKTAEKHTINKETTALD